MAILIFVNFRKSVEKCGNEKRKLKKRRCQRLALRDGLRLDLVCIFLSQK
jgi:hypothetical protein